MEAELANTRAALMKAEAERRQATPQTPHREEAPISDLMRTLIEALSATSRQNAVSEPSGSREWKPPTWDGRAETFRDYLVRLRSSYRVRSAVKPSLSGEYYWDTIYDTIPARERARMRHFWEKGSATKGKDPEAFFAQLENIFADSNEQAKALEQLTTMRHSAGQPWHEHQLEFDGLLLSADGESWSDATKIGYLKNTFSNAAKIYTATIPKTADYYAFSEEVERIMTNLETTDQFRAANRRWAREQHKESGTSVTVSAQTRGLPVRAKIDADGDTVMAPTQTHGAPNRTRGNPRPKDGKKRAKWVDVKERERRRENKLCFRCGGSGHRLRECPYAPAVQPTSLNATVIPPMLEDDDDTTESDVSRSGKE